MLAKDIYGIGFAAADEIAQKVGIPKDSINRARAGIDQVLLEATSDGHCALPLEKLKLAAVKLLEVLEGTVEQSLSQMLTSGGVLDCDTWPRLLTEAYGRLASKQRTKDGNFSLFRVVNRIPTSFAV
jgi:Helix-hairpin-helix containing domain